MSVDVLASGMKNKAAEARGLADSTPEALHQEFLALQAAVEQESGRYEFIENFRWPEGVRVAVNFTADFDVMLFRRLLNEPPLQLAKGEFGGRVGALRLVELFNKHDVKATFFTPGRVGELYPEALRSVVAGGHELADHMWEHRTPEDYDSQIDHLEKTAIALSKVSGRRPLGTRSFYPNIPLKECGHIYNSHGSAHYLPYYTGDAQGASALVELPFHFAVDDAQFFSFSWLNTGPEAQRLFDPERVLEMWWDAFQWQYERGGYLNVCLHPFVSGRALRIAMLDELISRMKTRSGVWFPTCETVARYCLDTFPPKTLRA